MRRTIVDDEKDAARFVIGSLGHHLGNQTLKINAAGLLLAPTRELRTTGVQRGKVRPSPVSVSADSIQLKKENIGDNATPSIRIKGEDGPPCFYE
ncbi:MAG: hypothetical protein ABI882_07150 [Acidobacteriota bacterium]